MTKACALVADRLYQTCDPQQFSFKTTAELADLSTPMGQSRAVEALEFGIGIGAKGYNIFASGRDGIGKRAIVTQLLNNYAASRAVPFDWCYVYNFDAPQKPNRLKLPQGIGLSLKKDMEKMVEILTAILPAVFDGEDYQTRRRVIEQQFKERREKSLDLVQNAAQQRNIALVRTPDGFVFAPVKGEEVIGPDEYEKLDEKEQARIEEDTKFLRDLLQTEIRRLPQVNREQSEQIKQLNYTVAQDAVAHVLDELKARYHDLAEVLTFLQSVERDVVENYQEFITKTGESGIDLATLVRQGGSGLRRYHVNVLVSHDHTKGAPVVFEDNPTFANLIGRVEHVAQFGALITDFTMIRAGALHRANGGFLVLDARKVLTQPFAWDGLKRALQAREICLESLGQALSLVSTVSLEAQPIPLDVKVVLLGEPHVYYALHEYDPEFSDLFKVNADFSRDITRSPENDLLFARMVATAARREGLLPFDGGAVARVIEQGARELEDAERVATSMRLVLDILIESSYCAARANRNVVTRDDVQRALDERIRRRDRIRERLLDETMRDTLMVSTQGEVIGQVNGLTVMEMGGYEFGHPSRITARVWPGDGDVLDIEREVELGGPLHSKGVLILQGFLAQRYAIERSMAMAASIVFEQSYGEVDGDSASCAELFALLSAIAEVPLTQQLAVTGSVNQHGVVQAIGGVNEKIEGFFKLCAARGLTGKQGVLIPSANVKHLMLEKQVVDAVRDGNFQIYAIEHVDDGVELLMGLPVGVADHQGKFPAESLNYRIINRLEKFHAGSEEGSEPKRKKNKKVAETPPQPQ